MRTQPAVDANDAILRIAEEAPGLLSGKLAPMLMAHPTVLRPRLLTALTQAVHGAPMTLISGPAGAGKTALAASWRNLQPGGRHIGWLTLDEYDDDPATFWSYAVEALAQAGVDLAGLIRPVPGESLPVSFVPRLAAALLTGAGPTVLIIDNADHLTDRQLTGAVDLLIRNAGEGLRFVLCARSDPQLPLHAYRLAGSLAEIRSADLAFTPEETADLLSAAGVAAIPEVAAALCERTEGWAVGLRLAVAPLRQGVPPDDLLASLLQDDGSVAQYLFEEVLRDQPATVRRFLMRISVTDELWPDLVERLAGRLNGRRILAGLAHANAFVEHSPGAPGGYRIHALFREMLRAQLAYGHPSEVPRLHRICAAWYAEAGRGAAAVEHAVAAGDWQLATHLLVEDLLVGRVLTHRPDVPLQGMGALPVDLATPDAVVVRAASAMSVGELPTVSDLALAADAAADAANGPALRASAAVVSVVGSAFRGSTTPPSGTTGAADELVASLPDGRQRERREMTAVLSTATFLRALASNRPTPALLADLGASAVAANAAGSRPLRVRPLAYLALIESLAGRLNRAERLARDAAAGWAGEPRAEADIAPVVAVARAWVHLDRYELEEARECIDDARYHGQRSVDARFVTPLAAVLQSCLLRVRHEYAKAAAVLQPHLGDADLPRWIREEVVTEAVHVHLARGAVAEGIALLDGSDDGTGWSARWRVTAGLLDRSYAAPLPLKALDSRDVSPVVAIQSGIVRACRQLAGGAVPTAVGELSQALDLAAPETLRRPFLDAPIQARRLLRTHPDLRGRAEWLSLTVPPARLRGTAGGPEQPEQPAPLVQDLSERETEVLVHLSEMLSTTEIAATMFISVNTVRTHIRSILRKLAATRRNQAVRRGRELGII
jgi:LuxR family maltose regulon positive regulatory protein